jgi:hypothetical protein
MAQRARVEFHTVSHRISPPLDGGAAFLQRLNYDMFSPIIQRISVVMNIGHDTHGDPDGGWVMKWPSFNTYTMPPPAAVESHIHV